jgi:hypothetical protein
MKLIDCHDCGRPVALSARQCPQCGSKDLAGPVRASRRAERKVGAEARNDRTLIWMMAILGAIGAFYGVETSSTTLGAIVTSVVYCLVGMVIGMPIAFAINVTRNWR